MNGTNLHDTGVRQMGRVQGGGRGGESQGEEEEWLLKRRRKRGNRQRVNMSRGGCGVVDVGKDPTGSLTK